MVPVPLAGLPSVVLFGRNEGNGGFQKEIKGAKGHKYLVNFGRRLYKVRDLVQSFFFSFSNFYRL